MELPKLAYLGYVQKTVDDILPIIESRTGIELYDVEVRDKKDLLGIILEGATNHYEQIERTFAEWIIFQHKLRWAFRNLYVEKISDMITSTSQAAEYISYPHHDIDLLLVNFSSQAVKTARRSSEPVRKHITKVFTVHELSHHLWQCIKEAPRRSKDSFWEEGYAMYGERIWFADINSPCELKGTSITSTFPSFYQNAFQAVRTLVKQEGEQILLELPNRWQEFDHIRKEITRS